MSSGEMSEDRYENDEWESRLGESEDSGHEIGRALTEGEASDCLACVGPTFRIVDDEKTFAYPTFAYIAMKVTGRNISDISVIPSFSHVIYLDLTNNRLTDESLKPLSEMKQLKALIIDKNMVENVASVPELNKLQLLSVKENFLTTCEVRESENLLYLDLSYNNIHKIMPYLWCPQVVPSLRELSMRGNMLTKVSGFLFSNLVSLFLGENRITKICGLELLTNLKFLHLRNNPLSNLDGFTSDVKKLFYLNVRDCQIGNEDEFKKLNVLPRLERIVVLGNPFWERDNSRIKLINMLPRLKRINKEMVDENERQAAGEVLDVDGNHISEETAH